MRKAFILIFMLVFISYAPQAFCAKHHKKAVKTTNYLKLDGITEQLSLLRYEIEALENGTSADNIHRLNKWMRKLEEKVRSKMQHGEARLEKYKNHMNETTLINEEAEVIDEKMRSSEKKIQIYQEALTTLEQLKGKLQKRKRS